MIESLNYAYGRPTSKGVIKSTPEDFYVSEIPGYELDGEGEHLYLHVEKSLLNTEEMAKKIAREFNLSFNRVSYAGLKDKYAKTRQWFSVHLPGEADPCLEGLNTEQHQILEAKRHSKKLKKGALAGNQFKICIQNAEIDTKDLEQRIKQIQTHGVPNYFGEQRFGHMGSNIERAKAVLLEGKKIKNRHLKGIYYSAARSYLFNQILSLRVSRGNWNKAVAGDLMMLSGTNSFFQADEDLEALNQRVNAHDISPALPLWGSGEERAAQSAIELQEEALAFYIDWCKALENHGLRKSYRAAILMPQSFQFQDHCFAFTLPKGAYATVLLRELIETQGV